MNNDDALINSTNNIAPDSQADNNNEDKPQPVDCIIELEIETGGYSANLRARSPLNGGKDVTKEQIKATLAEKKIVYGINEGMINIIVNGKSYDRWFPIAKCTPPQNGEDGKVEYLFDKNVTGLPKEDAHGYVDFHNLGIIRNITMGTVIANITRETPGTSGTNVLGDEMKPQKGREPSVVFGENIKLTDDKLQMIAAADGNLVNRGGKFLIDTVVKIDGDVDVSTGNVDFIGEVVIRGDVKEGFKVTSGKDILVHGGAYGASLTAAGKITVRTGVVGSQLVAGSSVDVAFAENSNITCYESLKAKSLYFCDAFCKGEVCVNTGNGSIIGGKIISTKNLYAYTIGSKSYTPTQIVIGDNAIMLQEKTGLEQKIEKLDIEEDKCTKVVEYLSEKKKQLGSLPTDKVNIITTAAKQILLLRNEREQIQKRIEEIDIYLQTKQNLCVNCKRELYPGVKITINDFVLPVNSTYQYCLVGIGDDGIEIRNQ